MAIPWVAKLVAWLVALLEWNLVVCLDRKKVAWLVEHLVDDLACALAVNWVVQLVVLMGRNLVARKVEKLVDEWVQ